METTKTNKAGFEVGKKYKVAPLWNNPVTIERRTESTVTIKGKRYKVYNDGFMGWTEYIVLKVSGCPIFVSSDYIEH